MADDAAEEEMPAEEMAAEEEMTPWYDTGVVWYGSLRGVISSGGDKDAKATSGSSRWGIKGSSEVSEGLTAAYQFETRVGQGKGSQDTDTLYVGLNGGFGSLGIGKYNNAAYLSGGLRDVGNAFGGGDVNNKVGSTVSYAYSTDAFQIQADAIMDGGKETGKSIDEVQFGMVVNLGDFGKVALGYENREDSMADGMAVMGAMPSTTGNGTAVTYSAEKGIENLEKTVWYNPKGKKPIVKGAVSDVMYLVDIAANTESDATATKVMVVNIISNGALVHGEDLTLVGDTYYTAACQTADSRKDGEACATDSQTNTKFGLMTTSYAEPAKDADAGAAMHKAVVLGDGTAAATNGEVVGDTVSITATVTPTKTTYGHKASHITAAFGLGAVTVRLGHTSTDSNDPMMTAKAKTNYLGFTGSIGDTGMDWRAFGRNNEDHKGKETSPWAIGVGKDLGGGAYTYIEHGNEDDGKSGTTNIGINVSF